MKNNDYWVRRKAEFVVEQMDKAENTAELMKRTYLKAQQYLTGQTEKIFLKYQRDYGLSETQARELLKRSGVDVFKLKRELQNGVQTDEIKQLLSDMDSSAYASRINQLLKSQQDIDILMFELSKNDNKLLTNHLKDISEDSYLNTMNLIQRQSGVTFSFNSIDAENIEKVLKTNWSGKHFSQAIWNNHSQLGQILKEEYLVNLLTGRSNFELSKVIENRFNVEGYKARRLVRTETTFVMAEMEAIAYEEADIEEYEYVSVLDNRTTPICQKLDGKIYKIKDRRAGVNYPPVHVFCRATTIAHFRDDWLEEKRKEEDIDVSKGNEKVYNDNRNYVIADKQIEKDLQKQSNKIFRKMLYNETDAVKSYTQSYYAQINHYLRGVQTEHDLAVFKMNGIEEKVRALDNILSNTKLNHNLKLYRYVDYPEFNYLINGQKEGIYKAYISTSISETATTNFGDCKIIINAPENTRGLYIGKHSEIAKEKEFLIARDTKYKILNIDIENMTIEMELDT